MKELPKRKPNRLEAYDYSQDGCYFITICTKGRAEMFGVVVGDGARDVPCVQSNVVGDGACDVPCVQLNEYGRITEKHIEAMRLRHKNVEIDKYVVMPNHIHMIISVNGQRSGTSQAPSPTNAVIPSFVSLLKRFIHKECGFALFQRSYHDHIIRNEHEYKAIWKYIDENPLNWQEDSYNIKQQSAVGDGACGVPLTPDKPHRPAD